MRCQNWILLFKLKFYKIPLYGCFNPSESDRSLYYSENQKTVEDEDDVITIIFTKQIFQPVSNHLLRKMSLFTLNFCLFSFSWD